MQQSNDLGLLSLESPDKLFLYLMNRYFLPIIFMLDRSGRPLKRIDKFLNLFYNEPILELSGQTEKIINELDHKSFENASEDFKSLSTSDKFFMSFFFIAFSNNVLKRKNCRYDLTSLLTILSINDSISPDPNAHPSPALFRAPDGVIIAYPSSLVKNTFENYATKFHEKMSAITTTNRIPHNRIMCENYLTFAETFLTEQDLYLRSDIISILEKHRKVYAQLNRKAFIAKNFR
jgi:hypothetical protein